MKILGVCCVTAFSVSIIGLFAQQTPAQKAFQERYGLAGSKPPTVGIPLRSASTPPAQPPPAQLRIVEGKAYDPTKSVVWRDFSGECVAVLTNGIVLQEIKTERTYAPGRATGAQAIGAYGTAPTRRLVSETKTPGASLFVRNFPLGLKPVAGNDIQVKAMHVGKFTWDGKEIEMWDCGIPVTPAR